MTKTHKRGDVREDGFIFQSYQTRGDKTYERWLSPFAVETKKAQNTKWRLANKDKAYAAYKAWFEKNKDKHAAYCREWRKRQKEKNN